MKAAKLKRAPDIAGRTPNAPVTAVEAEIHRLKGLSVGELRTFWTRRFRKPAPRIQSADLLYRLIAWHLQVETFGDLDDGSKQTIARLTRAAHATGTVPSGAIDRMRAGTVLV